MMKIYTAAEMREHEQMAVDKGTTFEQLMENAGQAAAADLLRRFHKAGRALIVCGKGNNGGDGLVIARVLAEQDWQVEVVFVLGEKLSPLAQLNRERLNHSDGVSFIRLDELEVRTTGRLRTLKTGYDLVIEGIFGTGFSGALPETAAAVCRLLNQADGFKIALDIPTGLNCDTGEADKDTFRADLTYAFAAYKPAHMTEAGKAYCGETVCLDIGIE